MKDTYEFIKDNDSNKIFIFINDNHLMIISVQTVIILSYVLSAYIKECIKKHNSKSKIESIVNAKDIDKHNEAKQNISSKKTTSTSISYVKKDSPSPDKSSFIEERENSFTMRLRVEKEKERIFRKVNKKEFKQKKKFSALSDFDDYEEVNDNWKVVKGGKLCELKA